jgi:hypothetical protein
MKYLYNIFTIHPAPVQETGPAQPSDHDMSDSDLSLDSESTPAERPPPRHRRAAILRGLLAAAGGCGGAVERPLPTRGRCGGFGPLAFDRAGPLARSSQRWTCTWARLFTQRLWTFGYAEQVPYESP